MLLFIQRFIMLLFSDCICRRIFAKFLRANDSFGWKSEPNPQWTTKQKQKEIFLATQTGFAQWKGFGNRSKISAKVRCVRGYWDVGGRSWWGRLSFCCWRSSFGLSVCWANFRVRIYVLPYYYNCDIENYCCYKLDL